MTLRRLPCGGSIATGDPGEGEILRVRRHLGAADRDVLFILARPPAKDAPDPELDLCLRFAGKHGFDTCTVMYLFPFRMNNVRELQAILVPQGAGPGNRALIRGEVRRHRRGTVIAAWGDDGLYQDAGQDLIGYFDGSVYGGIPTEVIPFQSFGRTRRRAPVAPTERNIRRPLQPLFGVPSERSAA